MKLKNQGSQQWSSSFYPAEEGQAWRQITNGIPRRIKRRKHLLWTTSTTKLVQTPSAVFNILLLTRKPERVEYVDSTHPENHAPPPATVVRRQYQEVISAPTPSTKDWQPRWRSSSYSRRTMTPSQLPLQTSARPIKNPFLRGEDLQWVYKNVVIISLCLSRIKTGNSQPRLSISIDRQVNPIIQDLNPSKKIINKERPRNINLSRPHLATSLKKQRPRKNSQLKNPCPRTPRYPRANLGTRFILRGEGFVTSQN